MTRKNRMLAAAAAAAVAIGSAAVAEETSAANAPDARNAENAENAANAANGDSRRLVVRASDILDGDVTNGLNTVGRVDGLVLDESASALEYVVVDADDPVWEFHGGDGYVPAEAVRYERGADRDQLDVRAQPSAAADEPGPDRVRITEDEAQARLLDQILGERLAFADQEDRAIDDVLLDPETGAVTHYVVRVKDGAFSSRSLALPAELVTQTETGFAVDMTLAEAEAAPTRPLETL